MNNLKFKIKEEIKNLVKIAHDPVLFATIIFSIIVVCFFILVPVYNVVKQSLLVKGSYGLANYVESFKSEGNVRIIINTLVLGTVTGLLSLIVGFFFSYITVYVKVKGKNI